MTAIARTLAILVALLSVGVAGCNRRAWTTVDSWYAPPGPGVPDVSSLQHVPREWVWEVLPEHRDEAVAQLASTNARELLPDVAARFTGMRWTGAGARRPFLLRAVVLSRPGSFTVSVNGDELFVHFGCLGHRPVPMVRQPIVALLERAPATVFVTASMAE